MGSLAEVDFGARRMPQVAQNQLIITKPFLQTLKDYAATDPENEVCGLITGDSFIGFWEAQKFHPIKNVNKHVGSSRDAYTMDPRESFAVLQHSQLMKDDVKAGDHLVATFHTHPRYTPYPSSIDIATAAYEVIYIIYSPVYDKFTFNLWTKNWFEPIPIEV